jgi:tetrahydromethanopterin S-methyltransferase subunit G
MTEWNDGRLDDLSKRVDRIETKMDAGFAEVKHQMDEGFARFDSKFDDLHGILFKAACGLVIGLLGLMGVLVGVIATKF